MNKIAKMSKTKRTSRGGKVLGGGAEVGRRDEEGVEIGATERA